MGSPLPENIYETEALEVFREEEWKVEVEEGEGEDEKEEEKGEEREEETSDHDPDFPGKSDEEPGQA